MRLGRGFSADEFAAAFLGFRQLYNAEPGLVRCSPDVLERIVVLFEDGDAAASGRPLHYSGVPIAAAVLAPGTVAFEGEVDEDRMGDW
ncbi:MAG: hypothetical protein M3R30_08230 [Candidatus Eremiobacteraeota bacterium]|nr:hypothetical protein [Candidatus Eremiobacteraeota bacterium]